MVTHAPSRLVHFQDRIMPEPNSGCWLWAGKITRNGYGKITWRYRHHRERYAHRFSYETYRGPIPDGLAIDHLCRVRSCVNPDHLRVCTQRENILAGTGMSARHILKTHCPRGHAYDQENTYTPPGRRNRVCRACHREKIQRKRYENA